VPVPDGHPGGLEHPSPVPRNARVDVVPDDTGRGAQPHHLGDDQRASERHQRQQAPEHCSPSGPRGDSFGEHRTDHARNNPRARHDREHAGPRFDRIHASDRDVTDRRHDAGAESLDEPADHEHGHRRRRPGEHQADGEDGEAHDVGTAESMSIGLTTGKDDPDHRAEEERGGHPSVPGQPVQVCLDVGQDRDDCQRLEGNQRHDRHEPDRQGAMLRAEDPRRRIRRPGTVVDAHDRQRS
jgi:hypothetical protein